MAYSKELRDTLVAKMLLPNNQSITRISKLEGTQKLPSENGELVQRANGLVEPATGSSSEEWSTEDKFLIVVETAGMT